MLRLAFSDSRRALFASMALLLAAAASASPSPAQAQSTTRLTGVVIDSVSGDPISDVQVYVRGGRTGAVTDARGRFALLNVIAGRNDLVAQRIGYSALVRVIDVPAGGTADVQLRLAPAPQMITPLVVSATREAQRREEGSATIDVIDGAQLRDARAAHPAGIMQRIPGVHVSQLSGEGHSTAIRQPITTKPLYLYLEDGIPTRSTGFFNHNALYEVNLPQAGGIEVLKGPGTALYGSDAIGGVVNALTRPAPVTPTLDVAVEGGDYQYRRMLATGGFMKGSQGVRADLNLTDAKGWKDAAPYTRQSATVRHDIALNGGVSLRTVLTGTNVTQQDVFALSTTQFNSRPSLNLSPIAFRDVKALRWSTAIEREHGSTSWSVTPFARHNVLGLLPNWQLTFDPEVWDTRNDSYGMLVKYRRDFAPWQSRLIAGADFDLSPGSSLSEAIVTTRSGPDSSWSSFTRGAAHYDYDVTYRQASPYLHAEFSPASRIRFDMGVRYDHSGYSYDNKLTELTTGRWRRPADTTLSFSRFSPKAGVSIDLGGGTNAFASFRQGFRAPAQSQLFQQGSNLNTVGLEPVTVNSAEMGVRGAIRSRLVYSVAAYDMRISNDILSILDDAGIRTSSNAGETRHRGIELAVGAALSPSVRVDAAWSTARQIYGQWDIIVGARNASFAGKWIEQAPRTLGNALLTWSPHFLGGGRLAAEWSHTGSYYMDPANTHADPGFDLWTLHANVRILSGGEMFVRVTNATDRKYAELSSYTAFNGSQFTPGNPRQMFAGMRWTWQQ